MRRLLLIIAVAVACLSLQAAERSNRWPAVREHYLSQHPACEACGDTQHVEVHHVLDFAKHPERECDPENLIALDRECHFRLGHMHDWKTCNPHVREDAAYWRRKIAEARSEPNH